MTEIYNYKNCQIHYSATGRGRALVFLHGFLEQSSMWNEISKSLKTKYRIVCIDLLGHGASENLGYIHSMEEQAEMVKSLITSLGLRRIVIIGHSMGGYIGLSFAKMYPKNLRGLILMNSTAYADTPEKIVNRERAIKAVKQNRNLFVKIAIPLLFSENNRTVFADKIKVLVEEAKNMSPQGIVAALEGMKIRRDRTDIYNNESLPIAMVLGKQDPVLGVKSLQEQIRNTHVQVFELQDGHMSHIENQIELLQSFRKFLGSL